VFIFRGDGRVVLPPTITLSFGFAQDRVIMGHPVGSCGGPTHRGETAMNGARGGLGVHCVLLLW
jgi:hypothetical protein